MAMLVTGALLWCLAACSLRSSEPEKPTLSSDEYTFQGGLPTPQTIQQAYDDSDLNRAIQAYKFFYPTVSAAAIWKGNLRAGAIPNHVFFIMQGNPAQVAFTPNSDTPYAGIPVDLAAGPIAVELPPGALMCVVNDLNQRYVMDLGLPGPDAGKGGRHLILPPDYREKVPPGYFTGTSTTNRAFLMLRAIPPHGDMQAAVRLLKTVKVHPLNPSAAWQEPKWIDLGHRPGNFTPNQWERNLAFWKELHEVLDTEPAFEPYRMNYGELAALGIERGKPFAPDARMTGILEKAARMANAQMRVQSFADRRPDRIVWPDRKSWEWAALRPENGTFDRPAYKDLEAREKWFYQAIIESPAMFRRTPGAGSLYWLGARDAGGAYLDGGKQYKLSLPQPVPAQLFWSVTVYDAESRSEIQTDQNRAALRSLVELKNAGTSGGTDLYFGPNVPAGDAHWIKTIPGKGWFVYLRLYGPNAPAFDKSWKPGDFVEEHKPISHR
jgi:hypothetical protein